MAKSPNKPCEALHCHTLTRNTWCKIHEGNAGESAREYNRYNRDPRIEGFYKSWQWQRLRKLAIERDHFLCQRCLKRKVIEPARVVHHIQEVKENWSKRFDIKNLESLCHACHNKHHKSWRNGGYPHLIIPNIDIITRAAPRT